MTSYKRSRDKSYEQEVVRLAQEVWHLAQYTNELEQTCNDQRDLVGELRSACLSTVKLLAAAVEARDRYTGGHVERVTAYCTAIGSEMGLDREMLSRLDLGAALHDLGKIWVSDSILHKTSSLDEDEWQQIYAHPEIGAHIVSSVSFLEPMVPCILYHHERFDGTGYPNGLRGEQIPIEGRIVAVGDVFDAMTTDRPYRRALDSQVAFAELRRCAGGQFDPDVVDAFFEVWRVRNEPADVRSAWKPRQTPGPSPHEQVPGLHATQVRSSSPQLLKTDHES